MLMGPGLDNMKKVVYTINNKRKRAEDRDNIKRETYPALFYYYNKQQKSCGPRYKNPEPQVTNANESNLSPHKHRPETETP
jgi:hypothetical protein